MNWPFKGAYKSNVCDRPFERLDGNGVGETTKKIKFNTVLMGGKKRRRLQL